MYLAETPSSALLEILVHLELQDSERPDRYRLLKLSVDEGTAFEEIEVSSLSSMWRNEEQQTQARGNAWVQKGETALLRIPSALTPETWNLLLNPRHKDAAYIRIITSAHYPYDPRLFK